MGYESDQGEEDNPNRQDKGKEIPFEGQEYDGNADVELANDDYNEHIGTGAIVTSIHTTHESGDKKISIAQVAQLATTSESESDQKITNKLVSSIKEQYESWGSGIKTTFRGPSAQQLKTSNQKTWASNLNVKPNQSKGPHPKTQIGCCPTAILKMNGIEALVCFDSGSELDTISPDFASAVGIKPITKENTINIHLAMEGSTSTTSCEVEVDVKSSSDPCSTLNAGGVRVRKRTLKVDSKSGLRKAGSETEGSGSMWKGQVKVQGSVSESINMLGGLEGLPA